MIFRSISVMLLIKFLHLDWHRWLFFRRYSHNWLVINSLDVYSNNRRTFRAIRFVEDKADANFSSLKPVILWKIMALFPGFKGMSLSWDQKSCFGDVKAQSKWSICIYWALRCSNVLCGHAVQLPIHHRKSLSWRLIRRSENSINGIFINDGYPYIRCSLLSCRRACYQFKHLWLGWYSCRA